MRLWRVHLDLMLLYPVDLYQVRSLPKNLSYVRYLDISGHPAKCLLPHTLRFRGPTLILCPMTPNEPMQKTPYFLKSLNHKNSKTQIHKPQIHKMTSPKSEITVTIIGGGIGGLVLALQLHSVGIRNITIFESSRTLAAIGSGINLQPSAVLVLRNLGLLPSLEEIGIKTEELKYYNRYGHFVIGEPRGEKAGYLVPQFSVHRGMLHAMLLGAVKERLGDGCVIMDHVFTSYEQDEGSVTAKFTRKTDPAVPADVQERRSDVLIACDGINSTARRLLYPDEGPPNFSGRLLWRGVSLREPFLTGRSMVWAGHADQKFIAYPVGRQAEKEGKSLVNWIAELRVRSKDDPDLTPPVADWGKTVSKDRFASQFKSWTFGFLSIPELIEETEVVAEFPMCDRTPVDRWTFGRLTLLGDAAHPLYPSTLAPSKQSRRLTCCSRI